ncbi:MAG: ABC-2 family transporter protein [bacterium]
MIETPSYLTSLMQKLLGRNYKWWYLICYYFKLNTTYLWNEIFASIFRISGIFSSLVIFTFLQQEDAQITTYLIIGGAYFACTDALISWFIGDSIKNGKISRMLILPQNFMIFVFFSGISVILFLLLTYSIILVPLFVFFSGSLIFSWNIFWLLLFWPISSTIRLFIEFLVGLSAFWTTEFYGLAYINTIVLQFFSGALFPLYFISTKFPLLNYTPFSILFYHPMQVYLGKYNINQTIFVFLGGIAWCVILYFLAKLVFNLGLKRNESVGL